MTIWDILDIHSTTDIKLIKTAYAKQLKIHKPETDPDGFKQLRAAYEAAIDFANGLDLDISTQAHSNTSSSSTNDINTNKSPDSMVDDLLDLLIENEENAISYFKQLTATPEMENLAFSDKFQEILAIRLIAYMPRFAYFICNIIDFFDWHEKIKNQSNGTYFKPALINLLNTTRPYALRQHIHQLASIKDKQAAKEANIDWSDCYAAKAFSPDCNLVTMSTPQEQDKQAIARLLQHINDTPEVIGLGLNLASILYWRKKQEYYNAIKSNQSLKSIINGLLFVLMCYIGVTLFFDYYVDIQNSSTTTYDDLAKAGSELENKIQAMN